MSASLLLFLLAAPLFGQPPPSNEKTGWDAVREQIRRPQDLVTREVGSGPESPLALTPEEARDPANGIIRVDRFETRLLGEIDKLPASSPGDIDQAESALHDLLRAHLSWRTSRPGQDAWRSLRIPVEERLTEVRAKRIAAADEQERGRLLESSHAWLAIHGRTSKVGDAVKQWWSAEAKRAIDANEGPAGRRWFERLVAEFGPSESFRSIEDGLRRMSVDLLKRASQTNAAESARLREEARAIWPESLASLKPLDATRTLAIAGRTKPLRLSPGAAQTDDERRCVDLLFRSLEDLAETKHWDPAHLVWSNRIAPRRWSDGSPIAAEDVRHALRLLEMSPHWRLPLREWVETTSAPTRDVVRIQLRQSAFPWRNLLALPVVPRLVGDKELAKWDDADFGRNPIASGRYRLITSKENERSATVDFDANPWERTQPYFDRIEWTSTDNFSKTLVASKPDIAFDLNSEDAKTAKQAGYLVRSSPTERGWFLVPNHRRAAFSDADFRRGLAFAIDRSAILKSIAGDHEALAKPLTGPFPPLSWAAAAPPQAPTSLHQADAATTHLRKAAAGAKNAKLVLLYATEGPDAEAAVKELAAQLNSACAKAELGTTFEPKGVPTSDFHAAIARRDFDLAYTPLDHGADLWSLWSAFDRDPIALDANGSNVIGFSDARLESLFRTPLSSRRASAVREASANLHAYLVETMPMIPLWNVPIRVALAPTLEAPQFDPLHPFAAIETWKRKK